jgi:hypothetical protein
LDFAFKWTKFRLIVTIGVPAFIELHEPSEIGQAAERGNDLLIALFHGALLRLGLLIAAPYIGHMSIRVKVEEGEIIVTDPTTEWFVSYLATHVATDRKGNSLRAGRFPRAGFRQSHRACAETGVDGVTPTAAASLF